MQSQARPAYVDQTDSYQVINGPPKLAVRDIILRLCLDVRELNLAVIGYAPFVFTPRGPCLHLFPLAFAEEDHIDLAGSSGL